MNNLRLSLTASTAAIGFVGNDTISGQSSVIYDNWGSITKQRAHCEGRLVALHRRQYLLPQIQSTPRGWRRTQ